MIITLDNLKLHQKAVVYKINCNNLSIKRRLMDMGITKGVTIEIVKFAPLGDPVSINVRGFELSLRKSELKFIEGEVLTKNNKLYTEKEK